MNNTRVSRKIYDRLLAAVLAVALIVSGTISDDYVTYAANNSIEYDMAIDGSGKNITGEVAETQPNLAGLKKSANLKGANFNLKYVTSNEGIAMIKESEGLRLTAYKAVSTEKYYTIGYGHYGADVTEDMVITEEKAEELLRQDLLIAENAVNLAMNDATEILTQHQFDALVSFVFNVGTGNFATSTIRTFVLYGISRFDRFQVIHAICSFNRSGGVVLQGLTNRRLRECAFFYDEPSLVSYDLEYPVGNYMINAAGDSLNVREEAKGSSTLLYSIPNGTTVTVTEVSSYWGKISNGWINLFHCYPTGESVTPQEPPVVDEPVVDEPITDNPVIEEPPVNNEEPTVIKVKKPVISSVTRNSNTKFTVTWNSKQDVDGIIIRYSRDKEFNKYKTVTLTNGRKTSKKITVTKAKSTYYVRIRTYVTVDGKKYYSNWSNRKRVNLKK